MAGLVIGLVMVFGRVVRGLFAPAPNEAMVLRLFGEYRGTERRSGSHRTYPFHSWWRISLRLSNRNRAILLRLHPRLWRELEQWAREAMRSANGQIEYLLREAVKRRRRDAGRAGLSNRTGEVRRRRRSIRTRCCPLTTRRGAGSSASRWMDC